MVQLIIHRRMGTKKFRKVCNFAHQISKKTQKASCQTPGINKNYLFLLKLLN